jgi:hemicentin
MFSTRHTLQPQITWTKNDIKVGEGTTFIIPTLGYGNEGIYVCTAKNKFGISQRSFTVEVVEFPQFIEEPLNVTINEDESETNPCEAEGYPQPRIYWTFADKEIEESTSLTLNSSKTPGWYYCVAENSEGRITAKFYFEILAAPKLMNGFEDAKKQMFVKKGENVELLCPFIDFDEVKWKRERVSLKAKKNHNKIYLPNLDESAGGSYTCEAGNFFGTSTFMYEIFILSPPTFNKSHETILLTRGSTSNISCNAKGYPKPKINWSKLNQNISKHEIIEIENFSSKSEGIYVCEAKNSEGITKKSFKLEMALPPFIENGINQIDLELVTGDSKQLECKISGYPNVAYKWTKNG